MKDGKIKSTLGRRVLITVAIAGLLGLFLLLYYYVFAPEQQRFFNKRAFRVLGRIAENFKATVEYFGTAINNEPLKNQSSGDTLLTDKELSQEEFYKLKNTFTGIPDPDNQNKIDKELIPDNIKYTVRIKSKRPQDTVILRSIKDIMQPIESLRNNSIFESVILIKKQKDTCLVLYRSGEFNIDEEIVTDSLLKKTNGFTFPVIANVTVEGIGYKLFLHPLRIEHKLYFLGGFINNNSYKNNAQNFPISYFLIISILIIIILISFPFLKIFLIGSHENISINDVRAFIAMIFIIPFLFVLICWAFWVNKAENKRTDQALSNLHNQVNTNFYKEINEGIRQLIRYDSLYTGTFGTLESFKSRIKEDSSPKVNFKDIFLYPTEYKNLDVVFWINDKGNEIAKWSFVKKEPIYLNKAARQYFKDISGNNGYRLPGDSTFFP